MQLLKTLVRLFDYIIVLGVVIITIIVIIIITSTVITIITPFRWRNGICMYTQTQTTVRSESRCALRLRYVDLVVSIEVAAKVCCCFTVFSC
jgi:hypothetical protein